MKRTLQEWANFTGLPVEKDLSPWNEIKVVAIDNGKAYPIANDLVSDLDSKTNYFTPRIPCPECGGSGRIYDTSKTEYPSKCQRCHGTGMIEKE